MSRYSRHERKAENKMHKKIIHATIDVAGKQNNGYMAS
jgi:hypothetical protein